jgi:hypothetical protein
MKMMDPKPTKPERLLEFQSCPLHGILRGVDCFFLTGTRFMANVWKYRNKPEAIWPDEHTDIETWEKIIEDMLAEVGLFYNRIRKDRGGKFNDGTVWTVNDVLRNMYFFGKCTFSSFYTIKGYILLKTIKRYIYPKRYIPRCH